MKEQFKNKWPYYLGGLIVLIIILFEAQKTTDFEIFISASQGLLLGNDIYTVFYHECFHYYYDVLFALILVPLSYLPMMLVNVIWLLLNVFFVYRIWTILVDLLPISKLTKKHSTIFITLSFIFILSFLRDNFHGTQLTIFILYLILEGLFLINTKKVIFGSMLIAFGITVKILPIVIIPYLIYRAEWKATIFTICFVIAYLFFPIVFIGYDYNQFLLLSRWHSLNPMNQEHILDTAERSFHSLSTLLATLLHKDCGDFHALTWKRNIADISIEKLNIVINAVRGVFILFVLYFLRSKPFTKTNFKIQRLYEISYFCLIIPLIFPHQQHYSFFFIFPATTYLIFYLMYFYYNTDTLNLTPHFKAKKITLIVFLSIIYFLTNSHFVLGQFNYFYDHYKTLTYGVIMLVVLLAICKPDKMILKA